MSKVKITPKAGIKDEHEHAKVYPGTYKKRSKEYDCFFVRGWKVGGKWQKKQFSNEAKANEFAATKNIELMNDGHKQQLVLTPLTEEQMKEAVYAFDLLKETYSLKQAVEYFLENHRPPEFTISITDGLKIYLDEKEREGVRIRTIRGIKGIITKFANVSDNPLVHDITTPSINTYLRGLKAKDGVTVAKYKTWNNHRNELSQFFQWSAEDDVSTNRPWRFNNPVEKIKVFSPQRVAEQRPPAKVTPPKQLTKVFNHLITFDEGSMVKMFALAYFAGIRPDEEGEMGKLAKREKELIDLKAGIIHIPANVSKTKRDRHVPISDNLKAWLKAYNDMPILPVNFSDKYTKARKPFNFQHDEARHSFISYHVAFHRSVRETTLAAGNSESMAYEHYLKLYTKEEGEAYFSIVPDMEKKKAVYSKPSKKKRAPQKKKKARASKNRKINPPKKAWSEDPPSS